ncbi:MAG: hypothetical protein L6461_23155 [Anaerolineae bacterium]|nr:hypothetical protein [Anaerolineae bacterium]
MKSNEAPRNSIKASYFFSLRGLYFAGAYVVLVILAFLKAESCVYDFLGLCTGIPKASVSLPWFVIFENFFHHQDSLIWFSIILNVIMFYLIGLGFEKWASKRSKKRQG